MASDSFEIGTKVMDFNPDLFVLDLVMPGPTAIWQSQWRCMC